jgi:hypothetical protein
VSRQSAQGAECEPASRAADAHDQRDRGQRDRHRVAHAIAATISWNTPLEGCTRFDGGEPARDPER